MAVNTISMTYSGTSPAVTFSTSHNVNYGQYRRSDRRLQPRGLSDGGDVYSYNHGSDRARLFRWESLPAVDMTSLLAFVAAVKGGVKTFSLTDYGGTVYTACRFLNGDDVPHRYVGGGRWEVSLQIEVK